MIRTLQGIGFIAAAGILAVACGSSSSSPSAPSGGTDGPIAQTFTITSAGITPNTATVPQGSRVTFTNNDNKTHAMDSNPHPVHTDCPALNVGQLGPGQSRTSQNLTSVRSCGVHDHLDDTNPLWHATITVQ